jgi:hypothetical protein
LPKEILPDWIAEVYEQVLTDLDLLGKVYDSAFAAINESITGIALPGMHLVLVEQTNKDTRTKSVYATEQNSITNYYPRGLNNIRVLDDNEFALTFRLVDGFLNYYMLRDAVKYMADDRWQQQQGERYKFIGDIVLDSYLSDNWAIRTYYTKCVFSGIDGLDFNASEMANEKTFTVRIKFIDYDVAYLLNGKEVHRSDFNHNGGN